MENLQLFPEPQAPSLAAGRVPLGLGRELPYVSAISHSSDANKTFESLLKSGLEQASDTSTKAELDNQVYLEKDSGKGLPRPV